MNNKKVLPKVIKPKFIKDIEQTCIKIIDIEDEAAIKNIYISDYTINTQEANKVNLEGVIFNKVDLKGITLNSLELTDVRFENCDLSNANFIGVIIHRTEFIDCKIMCLNLNDSTLQNMYMYNYNGQFILMNYAQMKNVILLDCVFENSNLQHSKFDKVEFRKYNFKLSQMSGTSLSGIDLSNSDFEGVGVRPEDIRGAIVSPMQAVDFSKLFGLIIKA